MRRLAPILVLCGCSRPVEAPTPDTGEVPPVYEAPAPVAEWSAADFEAGVDALTAGGLPLPGPVLEVFGAFLSHGDAGCPGSQIALDDAILGCTSGAGYYFSGIGGILVQEMEVPSGAGVNYSLYGDLALRYPTGGVFEAGGGLSYYGLREATGHETYSATWRGSWRDDTQPGWLGAGASGLHEVDGERTNGSRRLRVGGGVAIGAQDAFLDLVWDDAGACGWAAEGEVRLRDERGYWYVWAPDGCDRCGPVVFHGDQEVGEACFDLRPYGEDVWRVLSDFE